ncbi:hypothetical protein P152DRAFT_156620, partial [Eremomyces bilateralis CBS 781.70]
TCISALLYEVLPISPYIHRSVCRVYINPNTRSSHGIRSSVSFHKVVNPHRRQTRLVTRVTNRKCLAHRTPTRLTYVQEANAVPPRQFLSHVYIHLRHRYAPTNTPIPSAGAVITGRAFSPTRTTAAASTGFSFAGSISSGRVNSGNGRGVLGDWGSEGSVKVGVTGGGGGGGGGGWSWVWRGIRVRARVRERVRM